MNLTVFGATGGVGREVVTQALDAGHHVTAYVRNPAKLTVTLTVIDGTGTITVRMRAEGIERFIGMATPSLRDPRDTSTLLGRIVPFMGAPSCRAPFGSCW